MVERIALALATSDGHPNIKTENPKLWDEYQEMARRFYVALTACGLQPKN
jgi:hypothetical protein